MELILADCLANHRYGTGNSQSRPHRTHRYKLPPIHLSPPLECFFYFLPKSRVVADRLERQEVVWNPSIPSRLTVWGNAR